MSRLLLAALLPCGGLTAKPTITTARSDGGFRFQNIAPPAIDDAAAKAQVELIDGQRDRNGGDTATLIDGRVPFGNTFLSEIDITDIKAPPPARLKAPEPVVKSFTSRDGRFRYTIDATKAPDLMPWVEKELSPVIENWYPRMVAMMPSEGYTAPAAVSMRFKDDMGGIPAYATGNRLSLSVPFFRNQLKGEAKGCVIHELVHVIQNYGLARRTKRNPSPTPGWVTEGLADYVRWFLFEPEIHGAEITRRNLGSARYDGSYRISANFLDWVARKHDEDLLQQLNAAAREGRYHEDLWKQWTDKTLEELGDLWLSEHRDRLAAPPPGNSRK